jgi:uncharacterized membrane protein
MSVQHVVLTLLGAAAYAGGSHWLMVHAANSPWAVVVLLGPLLTMAAGFAWRARQWHTVAGVAAAFAALAAVVARGGVDDVNKLYVLQHAGLHAALGITFAVTLRQPLSIIGKLASRVHALTPDMVRYTRNVTLCWVAYFFCMAALSVATYALAPFSAWSLLANVLTPIALGSLFVGEYLLRYRLHPEFDRTTLMDAVRAWRANTPSVRR